MVNHANLFYIRSVLVSIRYVQ